MMVASAADTRTATGPFSWVCIVFMAPRKDVADVFGGKGGIYRNYGSVPVKLSLPPRSKTSSVLSALISYLGRSLDSSSAKTNYMPLQPTGEGGD